MHKRPPNEDVNARLNRKLWLMRLRDWKAPTLAILICLVVLAAAIRVPVETHFQRGEVTGVAGYVTDDTVLQQVGVLIDGQPRSAVEAVPLIHPVKGDIVCLRSTTYWPLGQTKIHLANMRFCDDPAATSNGD